MVEDRINDMIDEAINHLADDNANIGAEALVELAKVFAKAGFPQDCFMGIRQYIINEAIARTDPLFIQEKLKSAEKQLKENRCGTVNRVITH